MRPKWVTYFARAILLLVVNLVIVFMGMDATTSFWMSQLFAIISYLSIIGFLGLLMLATSD